MDASAVLDEIMQIPARSIPRSLLSQASGVVIIPNMLKGGFVVGVRHGRGVALVRDPQGAWSRPRLVEMTGGSVGFQAGVQSTDIVLVFMTRKSVDGLMRGTFTIGADAAAAAGPVGRNLAAATDERLKAEILSYSRSRGLFAGVSLDGSSIRIDYDGERVYYGPPRRARRQSLPESAVRLIATISQYSDSAAPPVTRDDGREGPPEAPLDPAALRNQLAEAAVQLSAVLPDDWRRYLALPAEVYSQDRHPASEPLEQALDRFQTVAENERYGSLAARPEFQRTHALLRQYATALSPGPSQELRLPPPPDRDSATGQRIEGRR
jgi:lipid-binding SYLF domain-containing protein